MITINDGNHASESMDRIIYLIQKHAPLLMKVGGGSGLGMSGSAYTKRTPEQRQQVIDMRARGCSFLEITQATGIPDSSARDIWNNHNKTLRKKEKQNAIAKA